MRLYQVVRRVTESGGRGKLNRYFAFSDHFIDDREAALKLARTLNADAKSSAHWLVIAWEVEEVVPPAVEKELEPKDD